MSIFFCDSSSDLRYNRVKQLGIEAIKIPYLLATRKYSYDMGKKFDYAKFYERAKSFNVSEYPLSVEDYINILQPCMDAGEDVLYVHTEESCISSFSNLKKAVTELLKSNPDRKISLLNTHSFSVGSGLIAYEAALLHKRGEKDSKIIKHISEFRNSSTLYLLINDLSKLRINNLPKSENLSGALLNMKPILTLNNSGKWLAVAKSKGKKRGLLDLVEKVKSLGENVVDYPISISHANCLQDATSLKDMLQQLLGEDARISIVDMSPAVFTQVGEGSLAIAFHSKKREE